PKSALFNLSVRDVATGRSERHLNLTVVESARRFDRVLADSPLVRYDGEPDGNEPVAAGKDDFSALEATLAAAQKALTTARNAGNADVSAEVAAVNAARQALDDALGDAATEVSDGLPLAVVDFLPANGETNKEGLYALEQADLFNLLCIPPYRASTDATDVHPGVISAAASYCEKRRAMLIVDSPKDWTSKDAARESFTDDDN